MRRLIAACLALCLVAPLMVGCEKKTEMKKTTETTTPDGSTTVTDTKSVETSGENPPPAK